MSEDFQLLQTERSGAQGRCERCKLVYGKTRKENESLLRCPGCDFPFGETEEAVRAIAFALQGPKHYVNVYSQVVCYVWIRVVKDFMDLGVEPLDEDDAFGTIPDWFEYELDNTDWPSIISPDWESRWEESDFSGTWNDWALQEGLCPGQRFLVEFKHPRWYRCSWEYEEYDVEYFWDIVAREPRSSKQAARAWEVWRKQCAADRAGRRKQVAAEKHKREHDVAAMHLRYDLWGDYYTEGGFIVALCSTHGGWMLQGRSPSNGEERSKLYGRGVDLPLPSHARALDDLIEQVKKHLPHLDTEAVRKLPRRQ